MYIGQHYIGMHKNEELRTGHPLTEYIHHCVHKRNSNFLMVTTGAPGAGKSYSCLTLAEALDPDFSVDRIVFDPIKFSEMISEPERFGLKKGNVIVFEEAGVNMPARDFQSVKNKMMSFIAQTFRHQNLIVLFNSPNQAFIDVNLRRLIHAVMEVTHHDNKYSYGNFYFNIADPLTGQIFQKPMMLKDLDTGQCMTLKRIRMTTPSRQLADEYEFRARNFKLEIAASSRNRMKSSHDQALRLEDMGSQLVEEAPLQKSVVKSLREQFEAGKSRPVSELKFDFDDPLNDSLIPRELGRVMGIKPS